MASVSISDVETGMVLIKDVVDKQNRVLLRGEVELTEKHIRILRTWGITTIEVDQGGEAGSSNEAYPAEWLVEAQELVDAHFQTANQELPLIKRLKLIWVDRFLSVRNSSSNSAVN